MHTARVEPSLDMWTSPLPSAGVPGGVFGDARISRRGLPVKQRDEGGGQQISISFAQC